MRVKKRKQGDETGSQKHNSEHCPLIMEQRESARCPVASFETYMARVDHSVNCFFQQPKRHVSPNFDEIWYTKIPVGEGTISDFLKVCSKLLM